MEDLRGLISRMETQGELLRIQRPVDVRHVSALTAQADKALLFEDPSGFDMPLLSGLINTRPRLALSMDVPENDMAKKFQAAVDRPIPSKVVSEAPVQEVAYRGEDVDITIMPIPLFHEKDGGPYISGGVACSFDEEYGYNAGMYRLMYRNRNETGIDLVSPSDMRKYYQKAFDQGKSLPIAVALGLHPNEMLSASYKAPINVDEFAIAGALHGEPVELVKCLTCDILVPANAEIVLECEILPVVWVYDEG
jgi:2,5-furandicarboxylate decarboxylase 1